MLYIKNYDKFNLDKSSRSQYVYYRRKFNALKVDFDYLLSELYDLLSTLQSLRESLLNNKELLQAILHDTKAEFAMANVNADGAFDYIETLLENAETALDSLEEDINNSISEIENNCSQTCSDEIEDINNEGGSCEEVVNCEVVVNCDECVYYSCYVCSFSYTDPACENDMTNGTYDPDCNVWVDEWGNTVGGGVDAPDGCVYTVSVTDSGEVWWTSNENCNEVSCIYSVETCEEAFPCSLWSGCTFECEYSTECTEEIMPEDCSYNCDDGGCVYEGGAGCDYSSNGNEVDDECGEEKIECTLYGNECFETECGEACGNCGQDCSEGDDCGDSWCGEDDTGCSEDDCCVYGGGSQSEGDDECGEDCGDCCVYG